MCSVTTFSTQCIAFECMTDCRFPGRIGSTGLKLFQLDHCAEILFTSPKTQNYDKSCYYFFPGFHPSLLFMSGLLSIGLKKFQNFIQRSIPLPTQAHLRLSLISDLGSNAIFEICGSAIELLRIGLRFESQPPVRECYMGRENFKTLCNQRILVTLVKWVRRNAQNCQNC